jgi:hypothetical protein
MTRPGTQSCCAIKQSCYTTRPGTQSCPTETQSCCTTRQSGNTILQDNPARQSGTCTTRQSGNTILHMHDQTTCKTILQDTCFERLKSTARYTAYSQAFCWSFAGVVVCLYSLCFLKACNGLRIALIVL